MLCLVKKFIILAFYCHKLRGSDHAKKMREKGMETKYEKC